MDRRDDAPRARAHRRRRFLWRGGAHSALAPRSAVRLSRGHRRAARRQHSIRPRLRVRHAAAGIATLLVLEEEKEEEEEGEEEGRGVMLLHLLLYFHRVLLHHVSFHEHNKLTAEVVLPAFVISRVMVDDERISSADPAAQADLFW